MSGDRVRLRRRPAITAIAVVAALGCGSGPAATAPSPRAAAEPDLRADDWAVRGPFLWEVQGDGGASFLFGTIHAGASAGDLPDVVRDRLEVSRVFVSEADLRAVDPREVEGMATLPAGPRLDEMVSPEGWNRITELLSGRVSVARLQRSRPWYVMVAMLNTLYPTRSPIDAALLAQAEAEDKDLVFLEDWRSQIRLLDELSDIRDLEELADPDSPSRRSLDRTIAAYESGDFRALSAAVLDPELVSRAPDKYEALFDRRNRAWSRQLREVLTAGRAFVAVGVGHYAGEHGLVELLRGDGFIVRRVMPESPQSE